MPGTLHHGSHSGRHFGHEHVAGSTAPSAPDFTRRTRLARSSGPMPSGRRPFDVASPIGHRVARSSCASRLGPAAGCRIFPAPVAPPLDVHRRVVLFRSRSHGSELSASHRDLKAQRSSRAHDGRNDSLPTGRPLRSLTVCTDRFGRSPAARLDVALVDVEPRRDSPIPGRTVPRQRTTREKHLIAPDSYQRNITPPRPLSLRTLRCTPAEGHIVWANPCAPVATRVVVEAAKPPPS